MLIFVLPQEIFKACFNRLLGGNTLQTLQLLLQSHYEDIHQEVLNELTAISQAKQTADWALPLLQQLLLNNTFASIRQSILPIIIVMKKPPVSVPLKPLGGSLISK